MPLFANEVQRTTVAQPANGYIAPISVGYFKNLSSMVNFIVPAKRKYFLPQKFVLV